MRLFYYPNYIMDVNTMVNYKSFRLQLLECRDNGTRVLEDCGCCGHSLLMCKKYGGQCMSKKCIGERTDAGNQTHN